MRCVLRVENVCVKTRLRPGLAREDLPDFGRWKKCGWKGKGNKERRVGRRGGRRQIRPLTTPSKNSSYSFGLSSVIRLSRVGSKFRSGMRGWRTAWCLQTESWAFQKKWEVSALSGLTTLLPVSYLHCLAGVFVVQFTAHGNRSYLLHIIMLCVCARTVISEHSVIPGLGEERNASSFWAVRGWASRRRFTPRQVAVSSECVCQFQWWDEAFCHAPGGRQPARLLLPMSSSILSIVGVALHTLTVVQFYGCTCQSDVQKTAAM